jgi:hypothetical protein
MELFTDQKSKNALHKDGVNLRNCHLNFQSSDPRLSKTRATREPSDFAYSSIRAAVRPPMGMYQQASRFFSKYYDQMYEKEDKEESKKKFFKFLQTAEQIDKEIQEQDKKPVEFKPEIEVSFDVVQPREEAWEQPLPKVELEEDAAVVAHEPVSTESKLVSDAKRIFTPEYLVKHFAKSSPLKTQRALENFVR